jgi:N-acetylglutamate synthase-like GNAT family acetyltransferase
LALTSGARAELGVLVGSDEVRGALFAATVKEALSFGCQQIYVLTAQPDQYKALGFTRTTLEALPEKRDDQCLRCSRLVRCQQVAMAYAVKVPLTAEA